MNDSSLNSNRLRFAWLKRLASPAKQAAVLGSIGLLVWWSQTSAWRPTSSATNDRSGAAEPRRLLPDETPPAEVLPQSRKFLITPAGFEQIAAEEAGEPQTIEVKGTVAYDLTALAQLSTRSPGTVWRVLKGLGDHVQQGDMLAIIDSAEVGAAKAAFLQALVQAELKTSHLGRLRSVGAVVPERQLREAEAAVREAAIGRFIAQQSLINLGIPIDYQSFQELSDEEREHRLQFLMLPDDVVAGLDSLSTSANLIPLIAPFDGVIIRQEMVAGEVVDPARTELVVADLRRMSLHLTIDRDKALQIVRGQHVAFVADGLSEPQDCELSWISTEFDESGTLQARAELDNPLLDPDGPPNGPRRLRANQSGTARICLQPLSAPVVAAHISRSEE